MAEDQGFLGQGWAFPPQFSLGGNRLTLSAGADDIRQSLQILFSTQLGERTMQDGFGADLNTVLFEEVDQALINTLTRLMSDAILYHEPRISLDRLDVSESDSQQGLLLISMDYTIRSTNSRYNMVYPFYLNEAANPA
ncbi:MAG: GPW/gp25 family protein [Nitrospirota bacterium]|nr:GPW/gp25 family protein [Nitrospirota bacterium]